MSYRPDRDVTPSTHPPRVRRDLGTRDGAEALARELDAWWSSRGISNVRHWAEWVSLGRHTGKRSDQLGKSSGAWVIRSNLVNGMPPR
jgi:hypothetical protein